MSLLLSILETMQIISFRGERFDASNSVFSVRDHYNCGSLRSADISFRGMSI